MRSSCTHLLVLLLWVILLLESCPSNGTSEQALNVTSLDWEANAVINAYAAFSGGLPTEIRVQEYFPTVASALARIADVSDPLNALLSCMGPCCEVSFKTGCPQKYAYATVSLGNIGVRVEKVWYVPHYVLSWAHESGFVSTEDMQRHRIPRSLFKNQEFLQEMNLNETSGMLRILYVDVSGYKNLDGETHLEEFLNEYSYKLEPQSFSNLQLLNEQVVSNLRYEVPFVMEYVTPASFSLNSKDNVYHFTQVYDEEGVHSSEYFDAEELKKVVSQQWVNNNPYESVSLRRFQTPVSLLEKAAEEILPRKSPLLSIENREYQTVVNATVQRILCERSATHIFCEGYNVPKNPDPLWPGTLRIATYTCGPFSRCNCGRKDTSFSGFSLSIWDHISLHLQIPIEYKCYEDQNAAISAVATGVADVGVGCSFITFQRQMRVHFSLPYFNGGLGILTKAPSSHHGRFSFLHPFSWGVWVILVSFVGIVYPFTHWVLLTAVEAAEDANVKDSNAQDLNTASRKDRQGTPQSMEKTRSDPSITERTAANEPRAHESPFEYILGRGKFRYKVFLYLDVILGVIGDVLGANGQIVTEQEAEQEANGGKFFDTVLDTDTPQKQHRGKLFTVRLLKRTLPIFALVFGVVMLALYTANLVSFLAIRKETYHINGPEDLAGRVVAALEGTVAWEWSTTNSNIASTVTVATVQDGVNKVLNGSVDAYIDDTAIVNFISQLNCEVRSAGQSFHYMDYGFFVQYGLEEFATDLNLAIQQLLDEGTVSEDASAYRIHDVAGKCVGEQTDVWHDPEGCGSIDGGKSLDDETRNTGIDPELLSLLTREDAFSPTNAITFSELSGLFIIVFVVEVAFGAVFWLMYKCYNMVSA